jgi:hypothetical protein
MTNGDINQWIQRARGVIVEHEHNRDAMYHTVSYLLTNDFCGIGHRVSMSRILDYLNQQGIRLSRENFQQTILCELKRRGIVATLVYPGRQGGVFIPQCMEDVETVVRQILRRIVAEVGNLRGLVLGTPFANMWQEVEEYLSQIERQFNER